MLEKQLFKGEPLDLVKENLRANSYKILADESYQKPLTDDEISAHRANVTEAYLKIQAINEDIKEYTSSKKEERKPFEMELKESSYAVKTGQIETRGDVYLIDDQESRMMGYYDETGRMISIRPLKPEERQTSFIGITRRAANDI